MMTGRVLRSEAGLVARDVGDGVGCHCAGVDLAEFIGPPLT
jgi:hypothetical protein